MATRVLLKDGFDAGLGGEVVEQLGHQHAVLAVEIVGDLARRRRRQDQRVVGRGDRREAVGEGAEAALIGVAPGGVDHDELGAGAALLHHVEHGFDADALAAHIGFLPDRGIDRDHVALAAGLHAVAAEEQHHHGVGADLGFQPGDRAGHVVLAGVFHHIDVEAVAAQRSGQRAGVVDRLGQRRSGVGIMAVADHQRDPRGVPGDTGCALLGRDRLGGIQRPHVQRRMGADRQRHHAGQSDGDGDRDGGRSKLRHLHHKFIPGRRRRRTRLVAPKPARFEGVPGGLPPIATNLRHCNKRSFNPAGPLRQPGKSDIGLGIGPCSQLQLGYSGFRAA